MKRGTSDVTANDDRRRGRRASSNAGLRPFSRLRTVAAQPAVEIAAPGDAGLQPSGRATRDDVLPHDDVQRAKRCQRAIVGGAHAGREASELVVVLIQVCLEYLASGMTAGEIVADFPEFGDRHVRAALDFAASRERRLADTA